MPSARDNAQTHPEPSRRALFAGGTAALLAAAITTEAHSAPLAAPGADAELIERCNRVVALFREQQLISTADEWAADRGPLHARFKGIWQELSELQEEIYDLDVPTTPAGAMATARAALVEVQRYSDGEPITDNLAAWLMVRLVQFYAGPDFEADHVWHERAATLGEDRA